MTKPAKKQPPEDEACVGCEYASGIVLHYCAKPTSESFRKIVMWEDWCPEFAPRAASR